jgi:thioredoxin reductase (NADPH)
MSESDIYDVIIIGGGPGGLTAGIYAMRAALKTVLIEMAAPGGQVNNSDSVENWPGDEHISGAELAMKFALHAQSYGLEMRSAEVLELEPRLDFHSVKLADGSMLRAHAVILATGGRRIVRQGRLLLCGMRRIFLPQQNRRSGRRGRHGC